MLKTSCISCSGTEPWEAQFLESFDYDLAGNRTNRRSGAYNTADDDLYVYSTQYGGPTDVIDKLDFALMARRGRAIVDTVIGLSRAESLRAMVEADPADACARAGLAAALVRANDFEAARPLYLRALAERPEDPELRERVLDLLHRLGDREATEEVLQTSAEQQEAEACNTEGGESEPKQD